MRNNDKDNLDKFNPLSDEGIFLGYSNSSRSYRILINNTSTIEEYIHVVFDESNHFPEKSAALMMKNSLSLKVQL